ncbi:MAG: ABC transporter substrate-binding protein, partial [Candidatus Atribacteria bacterium]|nr:ABC transporter substrate-binding protein [Candidatus Atribacteria bacterium]MCD6350175.1 ABC transporter substrate-binding protein [Candidatus Atribacteria bacterium]
WLVEEAPFPIKGLLRLGVLKAVEYPHALLTTKDLEKRHDVRVIVYNSALELTNALALGKVDLACSPLVTQVLFGLLTKSLKIAAGCGFGGSGLVVRGKLKEGITIGSSELSTMETMLKLFLEKHSLIGRVKVVYFKKPEEMVKSFLEGEINALSIWEPYLSELEKRGFEIQRYAEIFGLYPCCTLGVNQEFLKINEKLFKEFLELYKGNTRRLEERKEEALEIMAKLFGFSKEQINEGLKGFVFDYRLSREQVEEALERFGLKVFNLDSLLY